jgi:hypothetical protein
VQDGKLHAEVSHVPHTTAVAAAALGVLGLAAPVTIDAGTAHVELDHASASEIAEIVYTLTQFPSVERVDVAGRTGLTRADFAAYLPPILVDSPGAGAEVPLAIRVSGSASVFEAPLVRDDTEGTVARRRDCLRLRPLRREWRATAPGGCAGDRQALKHPRHP